MLNIHHTTFPSLHLDANQEFETDAEPDEHRLKVEIRHEIHEGNKFSMFIRTFFYNDEGLNVPYRFDVSCVGNFSVDDNDIEGCVKTKAFYLRNAAGVLFASIREMLASMTSRSPFSTLILPSYYFTLEQFLTDDELNSLD